MPTDHSETETDSDSATDHADHHTPNWLTTRNTVLTHHPGLPAKFPRVLGDEWGADWVRVIDRSYDVHAMPSELRAKMDVSVLFGASEDARAFYSDMRDECMAAMESRDDGPVDVEYNHPVEDYHQPAGLANSTGALRVRRGIPEVVCTFHGALADPQGTVGHVIPEGVIGWAEWLTDVAGDGEPEPEPEPVAHTRAEWGAVDDATSDDPERGIEMDVPNDAIGVTLGDDDAAAALERIRETLNARQDAITAHIESALTPDDPKHAIPTGGDSTVASSTSDDDDDAENVDVAGIPACPECDAQDARQLSTGDWVCQECTNVFRRGAN